jgi:hypothetical protein
MLEARVAALETHVEYIKRDVADIKGDVAKVRDVVGELKVSAATLTANVAHLPTKGFIIKAVLTTLAIIAALITFQKHVQTLFGVG